MANNRPDEQAEQPPGGTKPGADPSSALPADLPDAIAAPPPPGRARLPSQLRSTGRQRQETAFDSGVAGQPVATPKEPPHRHSETEAYQTSPALPAVAPKEAEPAAAEAGPAAAGAAPPAAVGLPDRPMAETDAVPMSSSSFKPASGSRVKSKKEPGPAAAQAARAGAPKGVTLQEMIARDPMSADEAVRLLCRIASPLQRLHADDKAHGKLTPGHALFVPDEKQGKVQLLDPAQVDSAPMYLALYTAPEMSGALKTASISPVRADVYALGCMLFEALTGRAPFVGRRIEDVNKRHAKFAVPAVRQIRNDIELPPSLELEIQRALKKRAGDRHRSAGEFASNIANASAEDDRGTLHLSLEEANVLQELIEQKTRGAEQEKRLAEEQEKISKERERFEQERQRIEADKKSAEEARRQAEEARQEAARQRAQAESSVVVARTEKSKSKAGLILGLIGLLVGLGGAAWFVLSGPTEPPPAPVEPAPVVPVEAPDAGATEPDIAPDVAQDAGVDAGIDAVDAAEDIKVEPIKVKRRPKPKPRPRPLPQPKRRPKPKPKPKPDPNRPVTF